MSNDPKDAKVDLLKLITGFEESKNFLNNTINDNCNNFVKNGNWMKNYKSGLKVKQGYVCSICDMWNEYASNYCPYCGAKLNL